MFQQIQQIFALVVPQGTNPHVRYCGARVICLVMIWFFIQGSGTAAASPPSFFQGVADLKLLSLSTQCLGGIVGSLIVLLGHKRALPPLAPTSEASNSAQPPFPALICAAVLALALVGNFTCAAVGLSLLSALLRIVACSLVTILFLEACLVLAKWSPRTALSVFFLVSLCRIVQNLIMLPFEMGPVWSVLSLSIELVLAALYVFFLTRQPSTLPEGKSDASCQKALFVEPAAPSPSEVDQDSKSYLPWQFIAHVMLYYFVIGVQRTQESALASPGLQTNCAYLLASTAAFCLFSATFVRTGNMSNYWVRIRQIAFPLLIGSCLLTGLLPVGLLFLALILEQTAYRFYLLSSYVEMFSICDITNVNARHVFAVTHLVMYIGMFVGGVLGTEIQHGPITPTTTIATALLLFLCLTAASCWLGNDKSASKVWGRRIELTPKGRQDKLYAETCRIITKRYNLTAKESEVLEHLARKQSLDQIAAALVVSKNTVRTHVRNLYAKVDAHSQSDIYQLFSEIEAEVKQR